MKTFKWLIVTSVMIKYMVINVYSLTLVYSKLIKNMSSSFYYDFFRFVFSLAMFALILVIAYFVTKFIAKKSSFRTKTKNMKIIEMLPLGVDKNITLVKVGQQYVLLGNVTKNIVFLSKFNEEELGLIESEEKKNEYTDDFDSYLDEYSSKSNDNYYKTEESYIVNIKNNLNKLKTMVRGNK